MTLDREGRSELHYAAADDPSGDSVRRCIAAGHDVALGDRAGWTPLHFAADRQHPVNVELLLRGGAPIDSTDAHGNTPLFRAVFGYTGDGETIRLLRAAGADPSKVNGHGQTPVGLARLIGSTDVSRHFDDLP